MATPNPEYAAEFTTILSWEETEAVEDAQQTIALRSRLLCYVLERYCDEQLRDALQELAYDIAAAAATIEAVMVRASTNGGLMAALPSTLPPSKSLLRKA